MNTVSSVTPTRRDDDGVKEISPGVPPPQVLRTLLAAAERRPGAHEERVGVIITGREATLVPPRHSGRGPSCEVRAQVQDLDGEARLLVAPARMGKGYWRVEAFFALFFLALTLNLLRVTHARPLAIGAGVLFMGFLGTALLYIRRLAIDDANRQVQRLIADAFPDRALRKSTAKFDQPPAPRA